MILALDISTSITGYCILDDQHYTVKLGAWDLRNKNKFQDIFAKADFIHGALQTLDCEFERVFIEKSLQSFRSGLSSAHTISLLAGFNATISWFCHTLHKKPEYIAAPTARRLCGIKVPKGIKAKEMAVKYAIKTEPLFQPTYTPKGNLRPVYYDMADALVIARAGASSA